MTTPTEIIEPEETRNQAFLDAIDSNVIESNKERMYRALQMLEEKHPEASGFTVNEIFKLATQMWDISGSSFNAYQPRVTEDLKEDGLVYLAGSRECRITGNNASTWATIDTIFDPFDREELNNGESSSTQPTKHDSGTGGEPPKNHSNQIIWKGDKA